MVAEVGSFRRYGDGRVCAQFEDFVVLTTSAPPPDDPTSAVHVALGTHLRPELQLTTVYWPDGRRATVRTERPIGVEYYVHAALQFATWAEKSPQQRCARSDISMHVMSVHLHACRR